MDKVSKTEDRLYEAMLDIGLRPERQYSISRMKVDFAFPKEMLVIEVDGYYKRNSVGMKALFERKRACEREGWKVENFTAEEVFEDADKVARRIYHMVKDEERKNKKLDNWEGKRKRNVKEIKVTKKPFIWKPRSEYNPFLKSMETKKKRVISQEREEELKKIVEEQTNIQNIKEIKRRIKERQKARTEQILGNDEKELEVEKRYYIPRGRRKKKISPFGILSILGIMIFLFLFLQNKTLSGKFEKLTCQTHFNELKEIIGEKMAGMDKNFGISDDPQDYLRVTFYGRWYNDIDHDIIIYFSKEMYLRKAYYKDIKTNKNVKELICNN